MNVQDAKTTIWIDYVKMLKGKTIYHMSKARPLLLSPKYQTEIEKVYTTKSCNMYMHPYIIINC